MTYYVWLQNYINHKSPIGDLANDAKNDSSFPIDLTSLSELKNHLRKMNAVPEAMKIAESSFEKYKKENPIS
ncbi:hypothetical protein CAR_c09050 [Carnobacterium sp. 17-4]|uniref:YozE family protein n=1 Tax=Carnobacterium sp. (strain 17-4) TaxID=208596 RepID=UPI0002058CEC|nr:YozE family protein [Carnobacterium sp. 17-4]AEB29598.1 hypothetical protein CAR_c09050 [Carnobacterium sp. 17-4]